MRTTTYPLSLRLIELGGWLTVCFIFWLLLLTHDVVGAPAMVARPVATTYAETAGPHLFGRPLTAVARRRTMQVAHIRGRAHAAFWQAREANRPARPRHGLMALLLPRHSAHKLVDNQRAGHRRPTRAHYDHAHTKPAPLIKLGPALGSIFQRRAAQ